MMHARWLLDEAEAAIRRPSRPCQDSGRAGHGGSTGSVKPSGSRSVVGACGAVENLMQLTGFKSNDTILLFLLTSLLLWWVRLGTQETGDPLLFAPCVLTVEWFLA